MSVECRLVLAGILAFSGCASAPQAPLVNPAIPAASARASASETDGAAGDTAAAAATAAVPSVEVSKLADTNPVTCRDMLIHGSNVLRTQCMTRNDWKVFDQAERIWAQDMLLRMQGFKR
jgi:hypothetical protein